LKTQLGSENYEFLKSLSYTIIDTNTKRTFFEGYDTYTIEFFDHKGGVIYPFDSKLFFISNNNGTVYYQNKESAIKTLYL
jgi:hypothetical protein